MFLALTLSKELTSQIVESVTYKLHPTFRPSVIKVTEYPFILSRVGWGYFTLDMDIEFKQWTGLKQMSLEHELSFERDGSSGSFVVEIEQEAIKNNLSNE